MQCGITENQQLNRAILTVQELLLFSCVFTTVPSTEHFQCSPYSTDSGVTLLMLIFVSYDFYGFAQS